MSKFKQYTYTNAFVKQNNNKYQFSNQSSTNILNK